MVLHIKTKPEDEKELKDLFQYAKEQNLVSLHHGTCTHISDVMDTKSTPSKLLKYEMGHAKYQGLMMGETIVEIALLLYGRVLPTANGDSVSLQMILFIYFKVEDKFTVFSELHQTEELRPVLAIIPSCMKAEHLI
jgi:hypothetical protein